MQMNICYNDYIVITVQLNIPSDVYTELSKAPAHYDKIQEKLQLTLAIGMFTSKDVSFARAADLAGLSLNQFSDVLNNLGIPVLEYSESIYDDDMNFVKGAGTDGFRISNSIIDNILNNN